jgi:hypothetical protein
LHYQLKNEQGAMQMNAIGKLTRRESGMTLATILALGVVMGLWAYALLAVVIPAYQRASLGRVTNILRSACEGSLDWMTNNLASTPGYDDAVNDGYGAANGTVTNVPSAVLPTGVVATVCVNNVSCPTTTAGQWASIIYDPSMVVPATPNDNAWRMVTATASIGSFAKKVTVIIHPIVTQTTLFQQAMLGKASVTLRDHVGTNSVDTRSGNVPASAENMYGDISSLGTINLGSGPTVGGNVLSYHPNSGTLTATTTAQTVFANGGTVYGQIDAYGTVDPSLTPGNVLNQDTTTRVSPYTAAINQSVAMSPPNLPATPTAPSSAYSLGAVNAQNAGSSLTLPRPGDVTGAADANSISHYSYTMSSLNISGNGGITIGTLPSNTVVDIYIQGSGATVKIAGNGITNSSGIAGNLRIWFGGTGSFEVAGNGEFDGVVYAPNTTVKFTGNGNFVGAVVGNVDNQSGNGNFSFDRDLLRTPVIVQSITGYQTLSWREPSTSETY